VRDILTLLAFATAAQAARSCPRPFVGVFALWTLSHGWKRMPRSDVEAAGPFPKIMVIVPSGRCEFDEVMCPRFPAGESACSPRETLCEPLAPCIKLWSCATDRRTLRCRAATIQGQCLDWPHLCPRERCRSFR